MLYTAEKQPAVFFATCARLLPNDVRVTVEQSLPGGLGPEDWSLLQEVIQAVKAGIPDAANAKPGEVFSRVLDALRAHDAKTTMLKKRTVLFARAKFMNDITGRFYN